MPLSQDNVKTILNLIVWWACCFNRAFKSFHTDYMEDSRSTQNIVFILSTIPRSREDPLLFLLLSVITNEFLQCRIDTERKEKNKLRTTLKLVTMFWNRESFPTFLSQKSDIYCVPQIVLILNRRGHRMTRKMYHMQICPRFRIGCHQLNDDNTFHSSASFWPSITFIFAQITKNFSESYLRTFTQCEERDGVLFTA